MKKILLILLLILSSCSSDDNRKSCLELNIMTPNDPPSCEELAEQFDCICD